MLKIDTKKRIVAEIIARRANYGSQAKMAKALGINVAQMSRILKGETERVLSNANFISIARKLGVELQNKAKWNVAKTSVFNYIWSQLTMCQNSSLSGLLCDKADIGKTFTAKQYIKTNANAVYIDCSQVKSKQRLIRKLAQEFGLTSSGRYADVYEDLVFYLKSIDSPLIILDEAGDLDYPAFLELKALWNATEHATGWYMMGADGLKAKIERNLGIKKVGYTELFSRFGSRYQKVSLDGKEAMEKFTKDLVADVARANGVTNIQDIYVKSGGSLRRIYTEVQKMNKKTN